MYILAIYAKGFRNTFTVTTEIMYQNIKFYTHNYASTATLLPAHNKSQKVQYALSFI